jgi:hypothetical protein
MGQQVSLTWKKLTYIRDREIGEFSREIRASHALLFNRNSASRKLARKFYGVPFAASGTPAHWTEELLSVHLNPFEIENVPMETALQDFPWLGERMIHLLETMENWKPTTFHELFTPGYVDRTSWWMAMFGIFFGFMSVLGLVLNAYQIFLGQRAISLSQQQINLAQQQISVALKALQLQFNTTG